MSAVHIQAFITPSSFTRSSASYPVHYSPTPGTAAPPGCCPPIPRAHSFHRVTWYSRSVLRACLPALFALIAWPTAIGAQELLRSDSDLDLLLNHGYLGAFFDPGIAGYETDGRSVRVLNVPVTFTVRDWKERGWGVRLRLAGVLGVENVDGVGDIPDARLGSFALIPGIEVPIPLSPRSLLRPFFDLGLAFALEDPNDLSPGTVGISALGLRSEFVFPWKRFELGLEPRAFYSVTWSTDELRDDYGVVGIRTDARYPLFGIGDKTLAGVLYVQPGWFVDALNLSADDEGPGTAVQQQIEIGVGYNWRGNAPKIWVFSVPPVSFGYSFGDGLEGIRLRVGDSRLTHLPLETWTDQPRP